MRGLALAAGFVALSVGGASAQSYSKAAQYLIAQEIKAACPSGGRFKRAGAVERDLTGDGRRDLVLAHGGLTCNGGNPISRRCGMQVCTVKLFVREEQLLKLKSGFLGGGVTLGPHGRSAGTGGIFADVRRGRAFYASTLTRAARRVLPA